MNLDAFPGGNLIQQGFDDLDAGRETDASLLVLIGSPRLTSLGFTISVEPPPLVEHRLYDRLAMSEPDSAHSRYNALIGLLVSFERAVACAG